MVGRRTCEANNDRGEPCKAAPLREGAFCVFHDPEHAEVVQEARRLIEVAAYDALGLDNTINRVRALGYLAQVAVTLLEKGEIEERLTEVEAALRPSTKSGARR